MMTMHFGELLILRLYHVPTHTVHTGTPSRAVQKPPQRLCVMWSLCVVVVVLPSESHHH